MIRPQRSDWPSGRIESLSPSLLRSNPLGPMPPWGVDKIATKLQHHALDLENITSMLPVDADCLFFLIPIAKGRDSHQRSIAKSLAPDVAEGSNFHLRWEARNLSQGR